MFCPELPEQTPKGTPKERLKTKGSRKIRKKREKENTDRVSFPR